MDCDNDHSDNKKDWVTPFDIVLVLTGVCFFVSFSRKPMKDNSSKSARPRFHGYFLIYLMLYIDLFVV